MSGRISVIVLSVVFGTVLAGCVAQGELNPDLSIQNESQEPVTLTITVHRDDIGEVNETGTPFYSETVTVDAATTRTLSVFTDRDQYRVQILSDDQSVSFPTRPICSTAYTNVTITTSGRLSYHAEFCEGLPATGTASATPR